MAKMTVQNSIALVIKKDEAGYLSLTDIAKYKTWDANAVIANGLRNSLAIAHLRIMER